MDDRHSSPEVSTSASDALPVTKAGVIFFERGHTSPQEGLKYPYLKMVIGKSDRYGTGSYVCLPKGAVDDHETPLAGGAREAGEETGIWLSRLLGEENYARLLAGEEIRNVDSPGYEGVKIVKASPEPVSDHAYASRFGRKFRMQLFAVELEGMDALQPHLKPEPDKAEKSKALEKLPAFKDSLSMMRSGVVKAGEKPWQGHEDTVLFEEPVLPRLEKIYGKVTGPNQWQLLCENIPGPEHRRLKKQMGMLQDHLVKKGLINDTSSLAKFDTSDRPLTAYFEWAEIGRASEILRDASRQATHSAVYHGSMWGGAPLSREPASGIKAAEQSQISGLVRFLEREAPMEIVDAGIVSPSQLDNRILKQIDRFLPTSSKWAAQMQQKPPLTDRNR